MKFARRDFAKNFVLFQEDNYSDDIKSLGEQKKKVSLNEFTVQTSRACDK